MRILALLVVALCGTSCVLPPSCFHRVFGLPNATPNAGHFATLTVYSQPIGGPVESDPAGAGIGDWFERGASITIDDRGRMAVSRLDLWPQRCPTISRDDLAEVAGSWQPVLEQMPPHRAGFQVMANPYTYSDDWRPDGPLVSLQLGTVSGQSLGLLWDGRSSLPEDLDVPVMATLEMICSNSRLARRYLLRDLPRQVTSRLECR